MAASRTEDPNFDQQNRSHREKLEMANLLKPESPASVIMLLPSKPQLLCFAKEFYH